MLHHVVTLELAEDTPEGHAEGICDALRALAGTMPEVRTFDAGADIGRREGNASLAITTTFDDFDAFLTYAEHPEHLRIIQELIVPHIADGQRVQFMS